LGPDETLASISPLPDNYDHSAPGKWSSPCHYCNLPHDATSFSMSYCPGFCVVKSIQNYTNYLSRQEKNPTQCNYKSGVEPCSLEFLVHYVGDIHQPLHVSYASDAGGNAVKVVFYDEQSNLHKVWDELIIQRWSSDLNGAVQELEVIISNNPDQVQRYLNVMDPILWANESYTYVLNTVYDFDQVPGEKDTINLGDAYYNRNLPIIKQRLIAGGVRLAQLLNNLFVGSKKFKLV